MTEDNKETQKAGTVRVAFMVIIGAFIIMSIVFGGWTYALVVNHSEIAAMTPIIAGFASAITLSLGLAVGYFLKNQ
jgi:hypothetical protein